MKVRTKILSCIAVSLAALLFAAPLLHAAPAKAGGKKQAKAAAKAPKNQKKPQVTAPPAVQQDKRPDMGLKMDKDFQKLPTFVNSRSLTLDAEKRIFTYSGNVVVKHGDLTLTCNALEGNYDQNNQIQTMLARGDVSVIKGENMKATGQKAIYSKATETITLSENPQLEQNGSILSATEIKVFLKDNRSVAEGDVRVRLEGQNGSGSNNLSLPGR